MDNQKFKQNCSSIIKKCNDWLEKNKDKEESWINYNFPSMFLHACRGNQEFSFSLDRHLFQNKNLTYKIKDNILIEIKFNSLYYGHNDDIKKVNEFFKLNLPVTFMSFTIPVRCLHKKYLSNTYKKNLPSRFRHYDTITKPITEEQKTEEQIKKLEAEVAFKFDKLKNYSFKD